MGLQWGLINSTQLSTSNNCTLSAAGATNHKQMGASRSEPIRLQLNATQQPHLPRRRSASRFHFSWRADGISSQFRSCFAAILPPTDH